MKTIKSVSGYNFAGYSSIQLNFDRHATYLIGQNGSGKSKAALDLVWFILQGIAEKSSGGNVPLIGERFRFIGTNGPTALGELVIHDDSIGKDIRVIRKLTKAGTELSFSAPAGMALDQAWLNEFFNLFLISPKKFIELSSKAQALALGIDTSKWDIPIAKLKEERTQLNREIKSYDKLEVVLKVDKIPLEELNARSIELRNQLVTKHRENQATNKATREAWENEKKDWDLFVNDFNKAQLKIVDRCDKIDEALIILDAAGYTGNEVFEFFTETRSKILPLIYAENFYPDEPVNLEYVPEDYEIIPGKKYYIKELPDHTELNAVHQEIMDAGVTNEKALLYDQYLKKLEDKKAKQLEVENNARDIERHTNERLEYIKAFEFPFSKLSVDEEGGLLLDNKPLKPQYFSSGELIRMVPNLISARNPEFKYVFLQEFDLLDEGMQEKVVTELNDKGFQLVIELVGKEKLPDKNCILLRNFHEVEEYPEANEAILINQR